jgi:hypothetical protein
MTSWLWSYLQVRVLKDKREAVQDGAVVGRDRRSRCRRERAYTGVKERSRVGFRTTSNPEGEWRWIVVEDQVGGFVRRSVVHSRRSDHIRWDRELGLGRVVDVDVQSEYTSGIGVVVMAETNLPRLALILDVNREVLDVLPERSTGSTCEVKSGREAGRSLVDRA